MLIRIGKKKRMRQRVDLVVDIEVKVTFLIVKDQ